MKRMVFLGVCLILLSAVSDCTGAVVYQVRDLGYGSARDINNAGQVIVNGSGALLWSDASGFVTLPMSTAWDINDEGRVAGEAAGAGVVWDFQTATTLGLGGLIPRSINNLGQMAGLSVDSSHWKEAFLREVDGSVTYLGNHEVEHINNLGVVVGDGLYTKDSGWAPLPGTGYGINDLGQVVGVNASERAFLWSQTSGTTDLGALFPGALYSYATCINNEGQVVGHWEDSSGVSHAYLWSGPTGRVDLAPLTEGGYARAFAVNDIGYIVGVSNGEAVLWTPIPESSSLLALACGLAGVGGFVARRRRSYPANTSG